MSQVEIARKSKLQERIAGPKSRLEGFLKTFEWTWATAVVFSLAIVFYLLIFAVIVPSFWMYFAEGKLGWAGPTDIEAAIRQIPTLLPGGAPAEYNELLLELRDAIAVGLTIGPVVTLFVVCPAMQNWRKKLRGGSAETRPTGGYR
jgi:hypothetical protein